MNIAFPTINACLNGFAGVMLLFGWRAIKANQRERHRRFMIAAVVSSALFLCSYVTYHVLKEGVVTRYEGEGILRLVYFSILLTHTPLAVLIVPFVIRAVWLALKGEYKRHARITRWLLPVWLYVSVTGVVIYLMLYIF
ncbi:MAG: DUF420 domain-containing protein [Planctomycetes bacterium]|nr:DUF420 domain-containing protein [Planctomycetota bacterium]